MIFEKERSINLMIKQKSGIDFGLKVLFGNSVERFTFRREGTSIRLC